jgi:hypothetical protein
MATRQTNKTDAGNGLKAISRVSNVLRSPSHDPRRSPKNQIQSLKMPMQPYTHRHKDGSIWATGFILDGCATGYWEWFRKDGTKMRSGSFDRGHQIGTWITYTRDGKAHKVTEIKGSDISEPIAFKELR